MSQPLKPETQSLSLQEAQNLANLYEQSLTDTTKESLSRLQESIRYAVQCFENEQWLSTQTALEEAMIRLLVAMSRLNMEAEPAFQRAINRLKSAKLSGTFHIFEDRAELWVQNEVRGEWPLYTEAEYKALLRLAQDLGCPVIHEEACQLGLFPTERLVLRHG